MSWVWTCTIDREREREREEKKINSKVIQAETDLLRNQDNTITFQF